MDWIVLLKKAHDIAEIWHVLSNQEGSMTSFDLLVVDNWVELTVKPVIIFSITQVILSSYKQSGWHRIDSGKVDLRRGPLAILLLVLLFTPVELLEFFALNNLSVMNHTLNTGSGREVSHVYLESIFVI